MHHERHQAHGFLRHISPFGDDAMLWLMILRNGTRYFKRIFPFWSSRLACCTIKLRFFVFARVFERDPTQDKMAAGQQRLWFHQCSSAFRNQREGALRFSAVSTSVLLFGCGIVVEAILVFVSASGQGGAPSACIVYEQIALKMRI